MRDIRQTLAIFLAMFLLVTQSSILAKKDEIKKGKKERETTSATDLKEVFLEKTKSTKEVEVEWKEMQLASQYRFQLYNHRNKILLDEKVETNAVKINLKPGKYNMRLAGISQFGIQGQWSDMAPLTVEEDNTMAPKEINETVKILKQATKQIEEDTSEANISALGIGASDIFGVGFEYATLNTELASFDNFFGGILFFRYHRIFLDNLKPELRLGYSHGSSNSAAVESMGILKLYGSFAYSHSLMGSKLFLVPMLGGGINYLIVTSEYAGNTFLSPGFAASLELSYQPVRRFRAFVRVEYTYVIIDAIRFLAPGMGVMWKF